MYVYYRGKRKARHKSTCHEGGQESKKNDDSTSANSKWKAEQGPIARLESQLVNS